MRQLVLFFALLLFTVSATADALAPHEAEYKVKIAVLGGELRTSLTADAGNLTARHVIKPTGIARMAAKGTIDERATFRTLEDSLVPLNYVSRDELSKDKSSANVSFNAEDERISGTVNGNEATFDYAPGTFDRLSIQYRLMQALANGERPTSFMLYDVDELKEINVRYLGKKEIRTPAGRYEVIGVQHQKTGSSRTTTLWCAEELGFLPVTIEQHRKGKLRMRAVLREYSPL